MKELWSSYKFLFCGVILAILISSCQSNPKVEKKLTIIPRLLKRTVWFLFWNAVKIV